MKEETKNKQKIEMEKKKLLWRFFFIKRIRTEILKSSQR